MRHIILSTLIVFLLSSCSDKIYLFNAKIKSSDINGTSKFGPKNTARISKVIADPKLAEPEYQFLGRVVSASNLRDDNAFFDLIYLKGNYGVLDSVYIDFLDEAVIPNLVITANDGFTTDQLTKFKSEFNSANSFSAKKSVMFKDEYFPIRKRLQKSVYRVISNDIVQNQKVEKLFKGGIESNIKSVLQQSNVELTADLKAKIESLVKSAVDIKGKYVDVEIEQPFLDKLKLLLSQLKAQRPQPNNAFLINYLNNFVGNNGLVAASYSLLQFEINYNTSKASQAEIGTVIDGVANLTPDEKNKLTSNIYANFSVTRDFKGESKSTKNYLVRYGYDNSVQALR